MSAQSFEFRNSLTFNLLAGLFFASFALLTASSLIAGGRMAGIEAAFLTIFVCVAILMFARAFDRRVQVSINQDGINDRRNGYGLVPWSEISQLTLVKTRSGWLLILHLKAPEFLATRARPSARKIGKLIGQSAFAIVQVPLEPMHVTEKLRQFLKTLNRNMQVTL